MIEIKTITGIPSGALELLQKTEYGVPGGLRYQHLNTSERLPALLNPHFICLYRRERLMGMVGLVQRRVRVGDHALSSLYVRYLTMPPSGRMKDTSKGRDQFAEDKKSSIIKNLIKQAYDSTLNPGNTNADLLYAYVDPGNTYSLHMCTTFGMQQIRTMKTYVFSRLRPRKLKGLRLAKPSEFKEILGNLETFYTGYNLFFPDHGFHQGDYYVIEEKGEIIAGVKAMRVAWKMSNIPGLGGRIILRYGAFMPVVRKIFNPMQFKFLAFEALWCKPGYESSLTTMLEGVCERMGYRVGMIWADSESSLGTILDKTLKPGLIGLFNKGQSIEVIAKVRSTEPTLLNELKAAPVYSSAFDVV